jgi:hydrogenase expression/formation protein HypC
MCLAIPGKLIQWIDREPPFAQATVEFAGIRRKVWMSCAMQAETGDYILVHAGMAITTLDQAEAQRTLAALAEAEIVEELGATDDQEYES